jgi:hypothetical protein
MAKKRQRARILAQKQPLRETRFAPFATQGRAQDRAYGEGNGSSLRMRSCEHQLASQGSAERTVRSHRSSPHRDSRGSSLRMKNKHSLQNNDLPPELFALDQVGSGLKGRNSPGRNMAPYNYTFQDEHDEDKDVKRASCGSYSPLRSTGRRRSIDSSPSLSNHR